MRVPIALISVVVLGVCTPVRSGEVLEPIETVQIGNHRELRVNGKPFLVLMGWVQPLDLFAAEKKLGFNTMAGYAGKPGELGEYIAAAQKQGLYVVPSIDKSIRADGDNVVNSTNVLGWIQPDKPDMPAAQSGDKPRGSEAELAKNYREAKSIDPLKRPVLMTFTPEFMKTYVGRLNLSTKGAMYRAFSKHCDILGFDIYPIYGYGSPSRLTDVADGVAELRSIAGPDKPVYAWIETNNGGKFVTFGKQPDVGPNHTRAEVWMAIIRGATVIGYFTHRFQPDYQPFAPIEAMQDELRRLNAQLTRLSPAILAAPADAKIEMTLDNGGLKCHMMATQHAGAIYIFAQNIDLGPGAERREQFAPISPRPARATFTIPGLAAGSKIEVVDEHRTIEADAGQFSDEFPSLRKRVYRIDRASIQSN